MESLGRVIEGQTRGSVVGVDDSALDEPEFSERLAHALVVAVGVDAQVADLFGTELEAGAADASGFATRRQAMDHAVGRIATPDAALDYAIG